MPLETIGAPTSLGSVSGIAGTPLAVSLAAALSFGATEVGTSSGAVANATCAASLPAVSGKTNYLTGLQFTFTGATLGSVVVAALTGLLIGSQSFVIAAPAGVLAIGDKLILAFATSRAASAPNTAITFSCPALGLGNTNACVNIQGFII